MHDRRQRLLAAEVVQQNQEAIRKIAEAMGPVQQNQEAIRKIAEITRLVQANQEAIRRWLKAAEGPTSNHENAKQGSDGDNDEGEEDKEN
jgi:hypothetical protein